MNYFFFLEERQKHHFWCKNVKSELQPFTDHSMVSNMMLSFHLLTHNRFSSVSAKGEGSFESDAELHQNMVRGLRAHCSCAEENPSLPVTMSRLQEKLEWWLQDEVLTM